MRRIFIIFSSFVLIPLLSPLSGREKVRVEEHLRGEKLIPVQAYYGVQTGECLLLHDKVMAFRIKGVEGITVNERLLDRYLETTVGIATALNPVVGYEMFTELADEAYTTNRRDPGINLGEKSLSEQQIKNCSTPVKLTGAGLST